MGKRSLNGSEWTAMVMAGAERLSRYVDKVNALNVFPVPDGDTGTNMNMTMTAGVAELKIKPSDEVGKAAEVLSRGLLMGARGNSGVILSQLFRGFVKAAAGLREIRVAEFATALQHGVDIAYKAVVKPVEGTMLTVAREAARHGAMMARRTADLYEWMREVHRKAVETLTRTPDMLPVLKQVGVVDSGGQGLVYLYEGFVDYLREESVAPAAQTESVPVAEAPVRPSAPPFAEPAVRPGVAVSSRGAAQARIANESIQFPYDMEFFIRRTTPSGPFPELAFRKQLERDGDSVIIIDDGDTVKVHVHSRKPGDVLNFALAYGELSDIRILNMRDQHRELLASEGDAFAGGGAGEGGRALHAVRGGAAADRDAGAADALGMEAATGIPAPDGSWPAAVASPEREPNPDAYELAPFGIVAVSVGEGNKALFRSLGVDVVLTGGQSMNPSTEDVLQAIESLAAGHVFVLPNNPNVLLAAQQAAELANRPVTVIPTRSIPQGMAAMLAFQEDEPADVNARRMQEAMEQVSTGQVTKAVRDTRMDDLDIREGHYIGIIEKTIVVSGEELFATVCRLLERMMEAGGSVVTVLTGEGADREVTERLADWFAERYPDAELDIHEGGQPLYPYLMAVEN